MAAELAVKENVIEMSMMSTTSHSNAGSSRRRGRVAGAAVGLALLLLLIQTAAAFADPVWRITSTHGPTNMVPGEFGQYVLNAYNIGDAPSTAGTTIIDTLPPGVTATATSGTGWSCPGAVGSNVVTCTRNGAVQPPGSNNFNAGAAPTLLITVAVDPGVSLGQADNAVEVSLGGALDPATTTDPTTFSLTPAGFGIRKGTFGADVFDAPFPTAGNTVRQAGSHPFELRFDFELNQALSTNPANGVTKYTEPDGRVRTVEVDLPRGFVGNPHSVPQCPGYALGDPGATAHGSCPVASQVGTADLKVQNGMQIQSLGNVNGMMRVPVYNVVPPPGNVVAFGMAVLGNPVYILARLDPTDYSIQTVIKQTNVLLPLRSVSLRLWGVPADPAHDALRVNPDSPDIFSAFGQTTTAPITPFLTLPSECGVDGATRMRVDSWANPGVFTPWESTAASQVTGCDDTRFRFNPSITVQPDSLKAGVPTGMTVDLSIPQKDDTALSAGQLYSTNTVEDKAIATPPLRDAKVVLPEGMAVSPSSADGLASCTSAQIALGTNGDPTCPDASKIGTISIDTPLIGEPLQGNVYLAAQNDNPFSSLLALYLVAKVPGIMVKLPGKIAPDPVTGQLTATFDDNPQLPFTKLHLHFNSGPRAPLVTPTACGTHTTTADFTSWNASLPEVQAIDSFTIDGNCARGFDPGFVAGTANPVAGKDSPLVTRFTRSDSDEELRAVAVSLPEGLLGRIATVDLCSNAAADAGTCGEGSRIGNVTVAAGPGSNPFYITDGKAYITDPYKGSPFGLSMVVHAKAGPLDLGNVIVRAQIQINKHTAALRVVTDPLPTILAGIPLQLRIAQVTVDRPGFTFNPTNCSELRSSATLTSTGGKTSTKTARFQVGDCAALPFKPRLTMRVGRKGHTASTRSTPLVTTLRMPKGRSANLAGVKVTLPDSLNALLPVIEDACTLAQFRAGNCANAKAGTATAVTPLLKEPLTGGVYFVKNGHPLPDLMVALRGQVDVDLNGIVTIPGSKLLATDFKTVPDVPITKFVLRLVDGKNGPIGVARNLCSKKSRSGKVALVFTGQNGKVVRKQQPLIVNGCAKKKAKKKR